MKQADTRVVIKCFNYRNDFRQQFHIGERKLKNVNEEKVTVNDFLRFFLSSSIKHICYTTRNFPLSVCQLCLWYIYWHVFLQTIGCVIERMNISSRIENYLLLWFHWYWVKKKKEKTKNEELTRSYAFVCIFIKCFFYDSIMKSIRLLSLKA
jgi:hypothetical protein